MTYYPTASEFSAVPVTGKQQLRILANYFWRDLVEITDPEKFRTISNNELVEQVRFVMNELLPRYESNVTGEELQEMAQTLSIDLLYFSETHPGRRTIH